MATKAIIFCRVSSKEQEDTGYSLDAQEKLLADYATTRGFDVAKVFKVSESASGKQARTLFNEMLEYVEKQHISAICVEKIDRLTRNLKDASIVNEWIQADSTRELHFVKESSIINKNTRAHENLVWDMKVAIARFYTNNLSEEVRKGQREKLAQGWLPTRAPLGYKTAGDKGHRIHVIDEEKAPLVRHMFELYSTGHYSVRTLQGAMCDEGLRNRIGKNVSQTRMYRLLSDPFYYGEVRWNDELYPGKHEPLIAKALFNTVQDRLKGKRGTSQYRKHMPVFKAKIRCEECSGTITWEIHKGHWYGHCNHHKECSKERWWRQETVETQLLPLFDKVAAKSERILRIVEKAVTASHADARERYAETYTQLTRAQESAQRKLDALYDDKAEGVVSLEFYESKRKQYTRERDNVLDGLKRLDEGNTKYYLAGYALHELAARATAIYQSVNASVEDKRLLLSKIFSNLSLNDQEIRPKYTLAFEFLSEWIPKLNETFEPRGNGSTQSQVPDFRTPHSVMNAWRRAFRTFDWREAIGDPELVLREVKQLLSVCDRVSLAALE